MRKCPKCKSLDVHQSRAKTRWEAWRKRITGRRPYRCRACRWRGWGPDTLDRSAMSRDTASRALAVPSLGTRATGGPPAIDFDTLDAQTSGDKMSLSGEGKIG